MNYSPNDYLSIKRFIYFDSSIIIFDLERSFFIQNF